MDAQLPCLPQLLDVTLAHAADPRVVQQRVGHVPVEACRHTAASLVFGEVGAVIDVVMAVAGAVHCWKIQRCRRKYWAFVTTTTTMMITMMVRKNDGDDCCYRCSRNRSSMLSKSLLPSSSSPTSP